VQDVDWASKTWGRAPVGSVHLAVLRRHAEFEFRQGGEFQNSATLSTFGHFFSSIGIVELGFFFNSNVPMKRTLALMAIAIFRMRACLPPLSRSSRHVHAYYTARVHGLQYCSMHALAGLQRDHIEVRAALELVPSSSDCPAETGGQPSRARSHAGVSAKRPHGHTYTCKRTLALACADTHARLRARTHMNTHGHTRTLTHALTRSLAHSLAHSHTHSARNHARTRTLGTLTQAPHHT
jgi:hypothetical protein